MRRIRIAILRDFAEEQWNSMDLTASMLAYHLRLGYGDSAEVTELCPRFMRFATRVPFAGRRWGAFAAERIFNRFITYPRFLRDHRARFDVFHIVDHSYANLVTALPSRPTIVTCHDLDVFRCLSPTEIESGDTARRFLARRTLAGMQRASRVVCVSESTHRELLSRRWMAPNRILVNPNGVHPSCSPLANRTADCDAAALLGPRDLNRIELLHVGSTIPRKRIDVLINAIAALRYERRNIRLIHAGGDFTTQQETAIKDLGLGASITAVPFVTPDVLAAIYRRAALLIVTSDSEGFGLPLIEAMACGTQVVATDLPVLREVGGEAGEYCPSGQIDSWASTISRLLRERETDSRNWRIRREAGLRQAARYSWSANAKRAMNLYTELTGTSVQSAHASGSRVVRIAAL